MGCYEPTVVLMPAFYILKAGREWHLGHELLCKIGRTHCENLLNSADRFATQEYALKLLPHRLAVPHWPP